MEKSGIYITKSSSKEIPPDIVIKFGGRIGVRIGTNKNQNRKVLVLNQLSKNYKVGELTDKEKEIEKEFSKNFSSIILDFSSKESINIIINDLKRIREFLK